MIFQESYKFDALEQLRLLSPDVLSAHGHSYDELAADADFVERFWGLYQKSVEEYGVDPDYAAKDALQDILDIRMDEWDTAKATGKPAKDQADKPLVYVCAPYSGDVTSNVLYARAAAIYAIDEGYCPVVPHLLYPSVLDDSDESQRSLGLRLDMELLAACAELWVFDHAGVTSGMQMELNFAAGMDMPVRRVTMLDSSYLDRARSAGTPSVLFKAWVKGCCPIPGPDGKPVDSYGVNNTYLIMAHDMAHAKAKLDAYLAAQFHGNLHSPDVEVKPLDKDTGRGLMVVDTIF